MKVVVLEHDSEWPFGIFGRTQTGLWSHTSRRHRRRCRSNQDHRAAPCPRRARRAPRAVAVAEHRCCLTTHGAAAFAVVEIRFSVFFLFAFRPIFFVKKESRSALVRPAGCSTHILTAPACGIFTYCLSDRDMRKNRSLMHCALLQPPRAACASRTPIAEKVALMAAGRVTSAMAATATTASR